jgi:hypothetical protein
MTSGSLCRSVVGDLFPFFGPKGSVAFYLPKVWILLVNLESVLLVTIKGSESAQSLFSLGESCRKGTCGPFGTLTRITAVSARRPVFVLMPVRWLLNTATGIISEDDTP